jgi:hypothetical protein
VLAVVAGVGWLYLLRGVGALDIGPNVAGALPLQQLAGGAAQPLLRLVVAWVPAGLVAGLALRSGTHLSPAGRAVLLALLAWVLLVLAGAASDAAAISASVQSHLPDQLTRAGTWVAVALMSVGVLLAGRRSARRAA